MAKAAADGPPGGAGGGHPGRARRDPPTACSTTASTLWRAPGRRRPTLAAEVLGVDRVEFLGYVDSGMMGEPDQRPARLVLEADVDEAAERLAAILARGGGRRAHRLRRPRRLRPPRPHPGAPGRARGPPSWPASTSVFEATMNRDAIRRMHARPPSAASCPRTFERRRPRRRARSFGSPSRRHHPRGRRDRLRRPEAGVDGGPRQPDRPETTSSSPMPDDDVRRGVRHRVVHRSGEPARRGAPAAPTCSTACDAEGRRRRAGTWTHTGYAQQIVFGAGAVGRLRRGPPRRSAPGGSCSSPPPGGCQSDDGAPGASAARPRAWRRPSPRSPRTCRRRSCSRRCCRPGATASTASCPSAAARAPTSARRCASSPSRRRARPARPTPTGPRCPHVSIPTTYSGAELTPFFGMTDPATRQKSGAGGPTIAPIAAIYDPELTLATPARVSAETGHERAGPLRRGGLVARAARPRPRPSRWPAPPASSTRCPRVVDDPDDLDARADMLEGAVLGGRCLQNGSMGVHHGLAQLVGGRTGIPHGLANAMILPHAIRFNADAVPDGHRAGSPGRGRRRPGRRGRRPGAPARAARRARRLRRHRGGPRRRGAAAPSPTATSPTTRGPCPRTTPGPSSPPPTEPTSGPRSATSAPLPPNDRRTGRRPASGVRIPSGSSCGSTRAQTDHLGPSDGRVLIVRPRRPVSE